MTGPGDRVEREVDAAPGAVGARPVIANAAIARELAGWCWSLAVLDD